MKRILNLVSGSVALLLITVLAAFLSMRLAIHGREVAVPNLEGRSDSDAAVIAKKLGLNLSVENRFYSAGVAPNHVLSQSPVAGSRVRRGWQVRVTESLGGQKVSVPDVLGQSERPASLVLRRLQLELGTVAHLPTSSPGGIVLAQSPPPNSTGLNGPRVSLLVSGEESAPSTIAYVMPSITGLTLYAASSRLSAAGLHIASASEPDNAPAPSDAELSAGGGTPDAAPAVIAPPPVSINATIISQSPLPGHRVSRADAIRVTLARPANVLSQ